MYFMRKMYSKMSEGFIKDFEMTKENKNFLIFLSLAGTLLIGVIVQNAASVIKPKTAAVQIDVAKVKQEIETAGLSPREAMHWKKIK